MGKYKDFEIFGARTWGSKIISVSFEIYSRVSILFFYQKPLAPSKVLVPKSIHLA
jgi:hypothetical protein